MRQLTRDCDLRGLRRPTASSPTPQKATRDAVVSYIDNFSWSTAPLRDITAPLTAGAVYVAVVLALHFWMKRRGRGFDTTYVQAAHNLVLCVGSLAMALGTLLEVYRRASSDAEGARWLFCERASTAPTESLSASVSCS